MLFRGLLAPGGKPDETAIRLFEDSTTKRWLVEEQGLSSSSPLKRPKGTPEPMETDESVDFSFQETNPSSEEFVHKVARKFAAIGKQLEVIKSTVNRHNLTAMDHHLSNVQRLIGAQPTGQAPLEILTHLESVSSTIKELLAKPRSVLLETEQQQLGALLRTYWPKFKLLTDNLPDSINNYLAPMEIFFQGCTSAQQPLLGDQLHSRLSSFESGLSAIQRTATNWSQPPVGPGQFGGSGLSTPIRSGHSNGGSQFGMGVFGQKISFTTPPGTQGSSSTDLENLFHRLTARIDVLENAAAADDGPPISLEGTQIKNKTQLKAWLVAHTSPTVVDLVPCFPDVLALLGMASWSTMNDVNSLDLESKAVKASYGSVNHFLISKSFTLSLPAIFRVEKEGGTGDVRTLPKFKTFESFDTQVTFTGGLNDIKQKVTKELEGATAHIEHYLTGTAKAVAKVYLSEASTFITELLAWMSFTYHMLSKAGGNTSTSENWNYVCHSVRAIFAHIQRARSTGYRTKEVANMT
jgi:hypothetical protein